MNSKENSLDIEDGPNIFQDEEESTKDYGFCSDEEMENLDTQKEDIKV